jgi:thiamine kinase-like enzyme
MIPIAPVLSQYGAALERLHWAPLGPGGGFSGASLWRGEKQEEVLFALKAWPQGMALARLTTIHEWMAQVEHHAFVPSVVRARNGLTVVAGGGRIWDLTRWMPGVADFHENPSASRLENACSALAELHRSWRVLPPHFEPCPAVQRRLQLLARWKQISGPAEPSLMRSAYDSVTRLVEPAKRALSSYSTRPVAVQPCLCDIWHDHVLFTDDRVTGIIDYGAMKNDHVAVDLARMLGDFVGDDDEMFAVGLEAYRRAGGSIDVSPEFVRLLDRTGTLCGTIGWLLRFAQDSRVYSDRAVVERFGTVVARLNSIRVF